MSATASSSDTTPPGPGDASMSHILDAMRTVLSRRFGIDGPDLAEPSELASLGLDSLGFIEYVFELESELKITLPDLPRDLVTVGEFARYVHGEYLKQTAHREAP